MLDPVRAWEGDSYWGIFGCRRVDLLYPEILCELEEHLLQARHEGNGQDRRERV